MEKERLCCNCLHCARWKKSTGIECHCDLDDRYLGYLEVMDEDINCKNWEKETKWDEQEEHDKQIIADAIDEIYSEFEKFVKSKSKTSYYWTELWCEFMRICKKAKEGAEK